MTINFGTRAASVQKVDDTWLIYTFEELTVGKTYETSSSVPVLKAKEAETAGYASTAHSAEWAGEAVKLATEPSWSGVNLSETGMVPLGKLDLTDTYHFKITKLGNHYDFGLVHIGSGNNWVSCSGKMPNETEFAYFSCKISADVSITAASVTAVLYDGTTKQLGSDWTITFRKELYNVVQS